MSSDETMPYSTKGCRFEFKCIIGSNGLDFAVKLGKNQIMKSTYSMLGLIFISHHVGLSATKKSSTRVGK